MNTARDLFFLIVGALLASGWWATVNFAGVPCGPNNFPVVGVLTGLLTTIVALWLIHALITAAFKDPTK